MNDVSKPPEKHLDYVIEKNAKPDHVIATELNTLFNANYSGDDVGKLRTQLKLPQSDPTKAMSAVVQPEQKKEVVETHRGIKSDKPISAAQAKATPKQKIPEAKLHFSFTSVSDENKAKLEALLTQTRKSSDFKFAPDYVTDCKKGKIYVYPGIGPVVCNGIQAITVAGMDMKTVSLHEIHPRNAKSIMQVPAGQIGKRQIRELASAEILEDALYKIHHGKSAIKGVPTVGTHKTRFFDNILASAELGAVVDLLCVTMGRGKNVTNMTNLDVKIGNACIHMLAAEYAVIKKMNFREAVSIVSMAVQKPTIDALKQQPSYGVNKSEPEAP